MASHERAAFAALVAACLPFVGARAAKARADDRQRLRAAAEDSWNALVAQWPEPCRLLLAAADALLAARVTGAAIDKRVLERALDCPWPRPLVAERDASCWAKRADIGG